MGRVLDRLRENRAKNPVITAVDSSFQVGNEAPQEAHVVSNTAKHDIKVNNPIQNTVDEEVTKIDTTQGEAVSNAPTNNTQTGIPSADDILSEWNRNKPDISQLTIPDASKLTIVDDMKQANKGVGVPKIENNAPTEKMVKENPLAIGLEAYTMNQVIDKAKTMEGGLSKEGNLEKAKKELGVDNMRFELDTIDNTYNGKTITPQTAETPQATEEEEDKKPYGDDWLYEFSKNNPKPNVLSDLGFHGFEKYEVPDDLLNYWGKDLTAAIDDIKDENGNYLTKEQKKRILRRIRGVRAGNALMQIANIAGQTAAISQGGTPVKMDNSTILGKIHNQAQAKQDAWLKQALKAKETANKNKMDMLNYKLDLQKALWGKEDKEFEREIQRQKAHLDLLRENRLISEHEYRMKKDALTLEEQKRHNRATENISQQNANTNSKRQTGESASKDYTIYKINGKPTAFLVKDIEKMSGEIVGSIKKVLESYKQLDDSELAEKGFDSTTALNRKIRELNEQIKDPETYFAIWMKEFPEETKSVANKYAANDAISEFVYKTKYGFTQEQKDWGYNVEGHSKE